VARFSAGTYRPRSKPTDQPRDADQPVHPPHPEHSTDGPWLGTRDVPAIALTAYARRADVRAVEDAGFQLHLVKPIRPEQLFEAVRSCVRGRFGDAP
jgi:CheY-like chemotaxis protein